MSMCMLAHDNMMVPCMRVHVHGICVRASACMVQCARAYGMWTIACLKVSYAACAGVDLHVLYVRCECLPMRTRLHVYMCACVLAHGNIDGVWICACVWMAFSMACACNTTCGACACAHICTHAHPCFWCMPKWRCCDCFLNARY